MHGGRSNGYCGPDRRQAIRPHRQPVSIERLLLLALAAAAASIWLAQIAHHVADTRTLEHAQDALRAGASGLFFGAGALRYARWRLTGESAVGYLAAALLVFGGLTAPLAMVSQIVQNESAWSHLSPLSRALTSTAALLLLARALRAAPVDSRVHPRRLALAATTAVLALFFGLSALHLSGRESLDPGQDVGTAIEATMAFGWLAAAVAFQRAGRRRGRHALVWGSLSMGLLGMS